MTDEIEAFAADEAILRACSITTRMTAMNILKCSKTIDEHSSIENVWDELDRHLSPHQNGDPIKHQMICQMQVMNSLFHQLVRKSNWAGDKSVEYAKAAFVAQKLYCDTAHQLSSFKPAMPEIRLDFLK